MFKPSICGHVLECEHLFVYAAWMQADQLTLDDRGIPLFDTTFVVVDLETTGGSPTHERVTEIGAVKVRRGEVLGEFGSLVDPGQAIPASIQALTGITPSMVVGRPSLDEVLPAFMEFAHGACLVAHNAAFDMGFLQAAATRLGYEPLGHPVLCTAALARRLVRDEVANCKLATLAARFGAATVPDHRALTDARATVDVLHALIGRAGSYGVVTLEDLLAFARVRNAPLFASRRHLADDLPSAPGVYAFTSASGEVLYVGKATDLRARVRQYFGNDPRRKIADLLKETHHVAHTVCPTPLEAEVRELRRIAVDRPRFNRRSMHPERGVWLTLTTDAFPRLSIVRAAPAPSCPALGPIRNRRTAAIISEAIAEVAGLRTCTERMAPATRFSACVLAEVGRCTAPCIGAIDVPGYAPGATTAAALLAGDVGLAARHLDNRLRRLVADSRYEDAAATRDRFGALFDAVARTRHLRAVVATGRVVASAPTRDEQREVLAACDGRLVASAICSNDDLATTVGAMAAALLGETDQSRPVTSIDADEIGIVGAWLERPQVRVHAMSGAWLLDVSGGAPLARWRARLRTARRRDRPGDRLQAKRPQRSVGSTTS